VLRQLLLRQQYVALLDGNWGTGRNECRARRPTQRFGELFAVKSCHVSVQFEPGRIPDLPARVFDAVLAATAPDTGVAPVMFGNKFGMRTGGNRLRFAGCTHLKKLPLLSASPAVFDA